MVLPLSVALTTYCNIYLMILKTFRDLQFTSYRMCSVAWFRMSFDSDYLKVIKFGRLSLLAAYIYRF